MNVLTLDIETAPHKAYIWDLWRTTVSTGQLIEPGYILCWAAKWEGDEAVKWCGLNDCDSTAMMSWMHKLLDQADIVVHWRGQGFDIPWINAELFRHGMTPPSPYRQIDLFKVAKKAFWLPSHKLDYVSQVAGIGQKQSHYGFKLWVDCMNGDPAAWELMKKYNIQDVLLTEQMYKKLQPWVKHHPSRAAAGEMECPYCGSERLHGRGTRRGYQRFRCLSCGGWSRGTKREGPRPAVTSFTLA